MNKRNSETYLLSREQAAAHLGIRPQTLASWACNGRYNLPFVRIGRRVLYRLEDLQAFIQTNLVCLGAA